MGFRHSKVLHLLYRTYAAARDEDPGLMLISRRPPQQKYTSFEEYMDAHGGATAPIEDHSEEV